VTRSHIPATATGAVALAVTAPVLISMFKLVSLAWPLIPILAVSSTWLAAGKQKDNNDNNNSTKT
jgi:hypothetical protein